MTAARRIITLILLTIGTGLMTVSCGTGPDRELNRIADLMSGTYINSDQARAEEAFSEVFFHITPVWEDRGDSIWFYVEQGFAHKSMHPFRQRFYNLSRHQDGTPTIDIYFFYDLDRLKGQWEQSDYFDTIPSDILRYRKGCTIFLEKTGRSTWTGSTEGKDCGSLRSDINYITKDLTIAKDRFEFWERGYYLRDRQIFGSEVGPHVMKRITRDDFREYIESGSFVPDPMRIDSLL